MTKTIYTDEYIRLTDWLREMRVKNHLTQRDLAEKMNWDNATLARIETRDRRLDVIEYLNLCRAIGCSPQEGLSKVIDNQIESG